MLTQHTDGIWTTTHTLRMPGGVLFPCNMTVVRMKDGGLWLHSPVPVDDAMAAQLRDLGEVTHIVAPSCLHHLYLGDVAAQFPKASILGTVGLDTKRKDLSFDGILSDALPPEWHGEFEMIVLKGSPQFNEIDFLHKPSGTLILTDLVFNMKTPGNFITSLVHRMAGVHGRMAQSRVWRMVTKDRKASAASVHDILSWDFDRVMMSHGDPFDDNAHERLAEALWWMRAGAPAASLPEPA